MFPDIAMWWYRRRYRKKLEELVRDLGKAGETLDTYRPLSELTHSLEMRADLAEAPATEAPAAASPKRERS